MFFNWLNIQYFSTARITNQSDDLYITKIKYQQIILFRENGGEKNFCDK